MSGKKNFSVHQSCQTFRHIRLQDSELKSWLSAYPADSRKAFCEVCKNAIKAKYYELQRLK